MYYNKSLINSLTEHVRRLDSTDFSNYSNQFKFFISSLDSTKQFSSLIQEACLKYPLTTEQYENWMEQASYGSIDLEFDSGEHHAAHSFQFIKFLQQSMGNYNFHRIIIFQRSSFEDTKEKILNEIVKPIVYFLADRLEQSSSILYLLEKYKKRTEWFTKEELLSVYQNANKSYEQLLEDNLRLFLFDQGIEYPFSTPKSASGRADIIGELDTSDPLIIEIKICDKKKNYGKDRIREGFTQIVKYASDYNKDIGYLVVFNIDTTEIVFDFDNSSKSFPPRLEFNNKVFYFIIVNLSEISASKQGTLEVLKVTKEELTKSID